MGWFGLTSQVLHYLGTVGADRDEAGAFLLVGDEAPSSFMGAGVEVVIHESLCYLVGGKPVNLAAGLRTTSYGMGVVVI